MGRESELLQMQNYVDNLIRSSQEVKNKLTTIVLATDCFDHITEKEQSFILEKGQPIYRNH